MITAQSARNMAVGLEYRPEIQGLSEQIVAAAKNGATEIGLNRASDNWPLKLALFSSDSGDRYNTKVLSFLEEKGFLVSIKYGEGNFSVNPRSMRISW